MATGEAASSPSVPPVLGSRPAAGPSAETTWLALLGLLVLVALLYQPAWHGGLLWDDPGHMTPQHLRSWSGLWRIWTEMGATQQYYPLTHSAFWLQARLWGDATVGYHLVNIALHATSAWLILLILRRLAVPGALLAALLFAVHPVHVESVAWISELKNTLSTALYLAAALVYLRFDEGRERRHYLVALGLFTAALLAKTVTASLPVALALVIWWRRDAVRWRRDAAPLAPMLVLGAAAGLLTAWVERTHIGAEGAEFDLTPVGRVLLAGRAVWFYLGKLTWPADLIFVYPRWRIDPSDPWQYLPPLILAGVLVGLWRIRSRTRAPLAALLTFLVGVAPALGFVDVFPFRYSFVADHFQYLASIPALAFAAAAVTWASGKARWSSPAARVAVCAALLAPLSVLTVAQSRHYESAEVLYRATLERNPGAWLAHNNLGLVLAGEGRLDEARGHFHEALRLAPEIAEHQMNVGRLLVAEGALDEGVRHLREAVRLDSTAVNAHSNLGVALMRQGRLEEALAELDRALTLQPGHPEATRNAAMVRQELGVRLARDGDMRAAADHLREAARLAPDDPMIRYNLGTTLLALGRRTEAAREFEAALRLNPSFQEARANLERARGW